MEFAGTNTYVQVRQSPSLDVGAGGGLTVEGWINPTNLSQQMPLVEWLAKVPVFTNSADTNFAIVAGPFLDPRHRALLLPARRDELDDLGNLGDQPRRTSGHH